jgi:hypothetical protein
MAISPVRALNKLADQLHARPSCEKRKETPRYRDKSRTDNGLRDMQCPLSTLPGCSWLPPAQSQGHIKAVTMARAVQNAIHNQRFRLGG